MLLGTRCSALQRLYMETCGGALDGMFKSFAVHNRAIHTVLLADGYLFREHGLYHTHLPRVSDAGIEALVLARKDGLRAISLKDGVTDRGLRLVVENCPQLNRLTLSSSTLTDEGCKPLMQLRYIRTLSIVDPTKGMFISSLTILELNLFYGNSFK